MPNVNPPVTSVDHFKSLIRVYESKATVDFNVNPAGTDLKELAGLAASGCLGFKIYMVSDTKRSYPHIPGLGVHNDGQLLEIFEAVEPTGVPLMVHSHNQEIMDTIEQRYWAKGQFSALDYVDAQRAYDGLGWDTANYTLLRMQEAVGTRLHLLHVVTDRTVELLREAKAAGRAITAEVNPFALFLGRRELIERKGPYVVGRLVPKETQDVLFAALRDGTIDLVGSDHAPHTKEEKEEGWRNMFNCPSGTPQLQDYLSKLLTSAHAGALSLDDVARVSSYNPARIFGLYPKKGTIEIGSDADLVVVDPDRRRTIENASVLSKCGWTPYDGDEVVGVPVHTLVRGRFVMRDGKVQRSPGWGRFTPPLRAEAEEHSMAGSK
jgi:dihydroorotase